MNPVILIDGEEQSKISIFNRNVQYGDGLFETCISKKNKILVLDPETKHENNKTFCFWSERNEPIYQDYEKIISKSWKKIRTYCY